MAGRELPAGNANSDPVGSRRLLGRAQLDFPIRCAAALAGSDGGPRLDGARLAEGLWRQRAVLGGNAHPEAGNAADRGAIAADELRYFDARAGIAPVRDRRAE